LNSFLVELAFGVDSIDKKKKGDPHWVAFLKPV